MNKPKYFMFEKIGEEYNCLIHLFRKLLSYCSNTGKLPNKTKIIYL